MINLKLHPPQIALGQASELLLEITNPESGPCNHLIVDIRFPVSIMLIKGSTRVELNRLGPGESYRQPLVVRGKKAGKHTIHLDEFSYRGPDGRIYNGAGQTTFLEVSGEDSDLPSDDSIKLKVSLQAGNFRMGEWSNLRGQVSNLGNRQLEGLRLILEGPVDCNPISLSLLLPRQESCFEQPVRFTEGGERVPVKMRILSPSGASLYTAQAYIAVSSIAQSSQAQTGGITVQGTQVEITYGNRTQVSVGGDAMFIRSPIGDAQTTPRCPGCNKEVSKGARFCDTCGTKIN